MHSFRPYAWQLFVLICVWAQVLLLVSAVWYCHLEDYLNNASLEKKVPNSPVIAMFYSFKAFQVCWKHWFSGRVAVFKVYFGPFATTTAFKNWLRGFYVLVCPYLVCQYCEHTYLQIFILNLKSEHSTDEILDKKKFIRSVDFWVSSQNKVFL